MPEGDTIAKLATRVNAAVGGSVVTSTTTRDPRLVGVQLDHQRLVEAINVGKYLLMRFEAPQSEPMTLYSHLHMDGEWRIGRVGGVAAWRRRVELEFGDKRLTGIDVAEIGLIPSANEFDIVGHLGPNLCGPTPPEVSIVADRLANDPSTPLAGALLDQRRVAGFGNVFAVELPFLCGVAPMIAVGDVEGLEHLAHVGISLIRWSGAGHPRNTTGRRLGVADHYLYRPPPRSARAQPGASTAGADGFALTNQRCTQCGDRLWYTSADSSAWRRMSWWCPTDQPATQRRVDARRLKRLLALHPAMRRPMEDAHA